MGLAAPSSARAVSRLFAVYAVASLVPILLLGAVLVQGARETGRSWGLLQARAQAEVIEQMAIAPALGDGRIGHQLSADEVDDLSSATDLAIFSGSVARLHVRSFTGTVVFSDDGSPREALAATAPAFRRAVAGGTSASLVVDPSGGPQRVIRVVEPIIARSSGQATGVLEVYLPYAHIEQAVHRQLAGTYRRLALGLAALYSVLGLIAWSNTRRLRRFALERHHSSLHDHLTGLPNREWFAEAAEAAVAGGARGERGALVLVDLDGFKGVNDTHGHHVGDVLLATVAERLRAGVRADDAVARLGGDEFGMLLPSLADAEHAVQLLRAVGRSVGEDVVVDGIVLVPRASFGVALYPDHGDDVDHLLQRADVAMYRAKRAGGDVVVHAAEDPPVDQRPRPAAPRPGEPSTAGPPSSAPPPRPSGALR